MTIVTIFRVKLQLFCIHQLKIKGVIVILTILNNIPLLYKNYNFGGKCGQRFKSHQLYFSAILGQASIWHQLKNCKPLLMN